MLGIPRESASRPLAVTFADLIFILGGPSSNYDRPAVA